MTVRGAEEFPLDPVPAILRRGRRGLTPDPRSLSPVLGGDLRQALIPDRLQEIQTVTAPPRASTAYVMATTREEI